MRFSAAMVLVACTAAVSAPAHSNDSQPIPAIANDLAFGYCPLYLAGVFPFENNSRLMDMGFGSKVAVKQDPRLGKAEQLVLSRNDGEVAITGVPGKACNVAVSRTPPAPIIANFKRGLPLTRIKFIPVPSLSRRTNGLSVEAMKGKMIDGNMMNVQLIQTTTPVPAAAVQIFITAN